MRDSVSVFAILVISNGYMWWLLIVRKMPNTLDNIVPYFLGIVEFLAVANSTDLSGSWWMYMGFLAVMGIAARFVIRNDATPDQFVECEWLLPLTLKNHDRGTLIVVVMMFLLFWMWYAHDKIPFGWHYFVFTEFYVLAIGLLYLGNPFLQEVANEFKRSI